MGIGIHHPLQILKKRGKIRILPGYEIPSGVHRLPPFGKMTFPAFRRRPQDADMTKQAAPLTIPGVRMIKRAARMTIRAVRMTKRAVRMTKRAARMTKPAPDAAKPDPRL